MELSSREIGDYEPAYPPSAMVLDREAWCVLTLDRDSGYCMKVDILMY